MAVSTLGRKKVGLPARDASAAPIERAAAVVPFSQTHRGLWLTCAIVVVLKSLIFAPIGWWPLAFVCLAPWVLAVATCERAPRVYAYSYLWALVFFLINLRWMYHATQLLGYVALSAYLAVYFPLMACPIRHAARRRGWPMVIVLPSVWVGGEMIRAIVMAGFPWFYLSHSLHGVLPLIQISDLVGAYGVSFLVAAANGALVDVILARRSSGEGQPVETGAGANDGLVGRRVWSGRRSLMFVGVSVVLVLAYGWYQLRSDTITPGPRVAVLQGDFTSSVFTNEGMVPEPQKKKVYLDMLRAAAAEKPDLYLLPESPWYMYLNAEERGASALSLDSFHKLQAHATQHQAYLVTGSGTRIHAPTDLLAKERVYNSAFVFSPDGGEPQRYDKVHLVPFGEYVPFRFGRLRPLYLWLNRITPFSGEDGTEEYSAFAGDGFHVFTKPSPTQTDRVFRFGIPICYEDVMPYVSREFVFGGSNEKRVDFLLNISNDGWFGRGVQQPQHLAISVFRAVENRVGIARAVNTGGSAFIEPSGRVYGEVVGDEPDAWPGLCGFSVETLRVDSRFTLYSRFGDWFAWGCALALLLLYVDYWVGRARA